MNKMNKICALLLMTCPLLAQAAGELRDIAPLPGAPHRAGAHGVSANGSVVAGYAIAKDDYYRAFHWSARYGRIYLGTLGGPYAQANAVSDNGLVVVGESWTSENQTHPFYWDRDGMIDLGTLGGAYGEANDVSADGSVVVGSSQLSRGELHAFLWTRRDRRMKDLGTLGGLYSHARGVSANGQMVVGESHTRNGPYHAFLWTPYSGMSDLGTIDHVEGPSAAHAISADGSVVVGESWTHAGQFRAFRWTRREGMIALGNKGESVARDVSADGKVIVGTWDDGSHQRGFRWTAETGMQSVAQWLQDKGVLASPAMVTKEVHGTNADGSVLVGELQNGRAFIARNTLGGMGMIDLADYQNTLQQAGTAVSQISELNDLVINDLHGEPTRIPYAKGQFGMWLGGDWGRQASIPGNGNIGAAQAGMKYGLTNQSVMAVAIGRNSSHQPIRYHGSIAPRGYYLLSTLSTTLGAPPLQLMISGYYSQGELAIKRGYLNAGTPVMAHGNTDYQSHHLRVRLDWPNAISVQQLQISPAVSAGRQRNHVDAYTENGGGFPSSWHAADSRTTTLRAGMNMQYPLTETISLHARLEQAKLLASAGGGARGSIIGLGNFNLDETKPKKNWQTVGLGTDITFSKTRALSLMVNHSSKYPGSHTWASIHYEIKS